MEHVEAFAKDEAFATALTVFITNISIGNIPSATTDYLASATLVALLKKNEEVTQALRELMGHNIVFSIRALVMSCVFVKLACKCVMSVIKDDIMKVMGPCKFAVGSKGGGGGARHYNGSSK